ncbi:MAG TPA: hypothetical protein VIV12_07615, partial [Streptosporangiaceae bacterium]
MAKHRLTWLLICGLAIIAICAFTISTVLGGGGPTGPSLPPYTEPGKTIVIVTGTDTSLSAGSQPAAPNLTGMYEQLVGWWNNYLAQSKGFQLKLETVTGGATEEHSEMLAAAQTGGGYDIYNLDSQWVSEFAHA